MKLLLSIFLLLTSVSVLSQQVSISGFTVKTELPGNINNWGADAVNIIAQGQSLKNVKMVIQITSGGNTICGNNLQSAFLIDNLTTRVFRTGDITSILGNCILRPGQYNLCIQFYNADNRSISTEQCRQFIVRDEKLNCAAPQNVSPANQTLYTEQQHLLPYIFRWTPLITSTRALVTYRFTLWEIEEGETIAQAVYNNFPIFQQDVKGQTQFILRPGIIEKRAGTYAWRVEAYDEQGRPFCKENFISIATSFSIGKKETFLEEEIPDSTSILPPAECNYCIDTLKIVSTTNNVNITAGILNIAQSFSISPTNITKVSAEIIYIKENLSDTSCFKCITDESSVWNFIPINTTSWNSGPLLNGSPANTAGFYPSKRIIWFTNKQGTVDMNLKIALPGTNNTPACKLNGKVCIRFSFTDANCKTCEKIICYNYSN